MWKGRGAISSRSVLNFCDLHKDERNTYLYDPIVVNRICVKLCEKNIMQAIFSAANIGIKNNYLFLPRDNEAFLKSKVLGKSYYNAIVYGFDYIYRLYKEIVVPLIWEKSDGSFAMGTGFKYMDGIVTAKHCIEDANNIMIRGYSKKDFINSQSSECEIYISDNPGVDIAFIQTERNAEILMLYEEAEVLDDVLVMGYPRIPTFTDFLTAEKATISSRAEARITPTVGAVAAIADEFLCKMEALLITAKIRGGNSGGPVINRNGCVVGVACRLPDYSYNEDDYYDDLGYGIAIPFSYAMDIIRNRINRLEVAEDFFRDYRI